VILSPNEIHTHFPFHKIDAVTFPEQQINCWEASAAFSKIRGCIGEIFKINPS
jgi:hypothetical protein